MVDLARLGEVRAENTARHDIGLGVAEGALAAQRELGDHPEREQVGAERGGQSAQHLRGEVAEQGELQAVASCRGAAPIERAAAELQAARQLAQGLLEHETLSIADINNLLEGRKLSFVKPKGGAEKPTGAVSS